MVSFRCILKEGLIGFFEVLVGVREGVEIKEGIWKSDVVMN